MYHWLSDKKFLRKMRSLSGEIMQTLCHYLKEDYGIGATFYLVGSGARNLILQNGNASVDLDCNLEIVKCEECDDGRWLKECVRKTFNKVLRKYRLPDCEDSTSSLTSKTIYFRDEATGFSIDVCITMRDDEDNTCRLIHQKTGWIQQDQYYWNEAPCSKDLKKKADHIKESGQWDTVREQYLNIKNRYLIRSDRNHPSFVCYAEAVNNVYNQIRQRERKL